MPTPALSDPDRFACLAAYAALVYHEARNVRHLIRAGVVEPQEWKYLVALPVNREAAWQALQDARAQARQANDATGVLEVFELRFRVSLTQLVELYGNQAWRSQPYGGNAWKRIAELVRKLAACLDAGRLSEAEGLLDALRTVRHNTGTLVDKLSRLDRARGFERKV